VRGVYCGHGRVNLEPLTGFLGFLTLFRGSVDCKDVCRDVFEPFYWTNIPHDLASFLVGASSAALNQCFQVLLLLNPPIYKCICLVRRNSMCALIFRVFKESLDYRQQAVAHANPQLQCQTSLHRYTLSSSSLFSSIARSLTFHLASA
jgi:hypothetical protein